MEPKPIAELHTSILGILLLNSYKTLTTYRCFEQQQFAGYPFLWLYETVHYPIYLDFSSQHPLQYKHSFIRTLFDRVKCIVSDSYDIKQELSHISTALQHYGYPSWSTAAAKSLFQLVDSLR